MISSLDRTKDVLLSLHPCDDDNKHSYLVHDLWNKITSMGEEINDKIVLGETELVTESLSTDIWTKVFDGGKRIYVYVGNTGFKYLYDRTNTNQPTSSFDFMPEGKTS